MEPSPLSKSTPRRRHLIWWLFLIFIPLISAPEWGRHVLLLYINSTVLPGALIKEIHFPKRWDFSSLELIDCSFPIPLLSPSSASAPSYGNIVSPKIRVTWGWKDSWRPQLLSCEIDELVCTVDLSVSSSFLENPAQELSDLLKNTLKILAYLDSEKASLPLSFANAQLIIKSPLSSKLSSQRWEISKTSSTRGEDLLLLTFHNAESGEKGSLSCQRQKDQTLFTQLKFTPQRTLKSQVQAQLLYTPASSDLEVTLEGEHKFESLSPQAFHGIFKGTLQGNLPSPQLNYEGTVKLGVQKIAQTKGHFLVNTGEGEANTTFSCPFDKIFTGKEPFLKNLGKIKELTGQLSGKATIRWQDKGETQKEIEASLALALKSSKLHVTNGKAKFLMKPDSSGTMTVMISEMLWSTLSLQNLQATLSLEGFLTPPKLTHFVCNLWGGTLKIPSATFLGGEGKADLHLSNIQLKPFLQCLEIPNLAGDGLIDGEMKVAITPPDIRLIQAHLYSTKGNVQYTPPSSGSSDKGANLAFEVGRDLHFKKLDVTLREAKKGVEGKVQIAGSNPKVMDGYPFEFNINVTGQLSELATDILKNFHFSPELYKKAQTED